MRSLALPTRTAERHDTRVSTIPEMLPGDASPPRRRRRWPLVVAIVVVVLVIAGVVANSIRLNVYALSPGSAQPVARLITVPAGKGHAPPDIYLTDVFVTQVRALDWPLYALNSNDTMYSTAALFGPGNPQPAEIQAAQALEMAQGSQTARVEALRYLGYKVPERHGAVIWEIEPGSAASKVPGLALGDAITAIDGTATGSAQALTSTVEDHRPGQRITLSLQQVSGGRRDATLVLGHRPGHPHEPFMGVALAPSPYNTYFQLPFKVDINSAGIGGPSAGLAFTLGVIDALSGGKLTGGHKVAVTGTINLKGDVGLVGGVPQKTVAVRRAGATVFMVPPGNDHQALSKAGSSLKVVPVSSLKQALAELRRLGGDVPAPGSAARAG